MALMKTKTLLPSARTWALFDLLFTRMGQGNLLRLSRESKVPYATTHDLMNRLLKAGSVEETRRGRSREFRATEKGLRSWRETFRSVPVPFHETKSLVADQLHSPPDLPPSRDLEQALVALMVESRKDPSLSRALPVVLAKEMERLDVDRLKNRALESDAGAMVGFYLELTALLSSSSRLKKMSRSFRDRRRRTVRVFFESSRREDKWESRLLERRTPELARRWGWLMNMPLESFRTHFEKFHPAGEGEA